MKSADWRALVAQNVKAKRDAENGVARQTTPPLFCKDCLYHSAEFDREKGKIKHFCSHPAMLNMITGEKTHPATNRNTETLCGREARHFTRRPLVIEQKREPDNEPPPMLPFFVPRNTL